MNTNLAYQEEYISTELINGQVVLMSPSPAINHNRVKGNIYNLFKNHLRGRSCEAFTDSTDVYLTEKDCFIPDVMIVCDADKIKKDGVHGAPDLVVEVLSPSTMKRDRTYKKEVYAKCGVKEYWLVDTNNKTVEQYLLQDGQLVLHEIYTVFPDFMLEKMSEEERAGLITEFKCSLYDDLLIKLEDVFERVTL